MRFVLFHLALCIVHVAFRRRVTTPKQEDYRCMSGRTGRGLATLHLVFGGRTTTLTWKKNELASYIRGDQRVRTINDTWGGGGGGAM